MSTIYVVDIVLLVILYLLIMFMCGYSFFCVYRLLRSMQMRILLRPTRVVFSHKKEGESTEELRTVVAYQNPFTGDYCVNKSRLKRGYINSLPQSSDSGLSDEYEPLHLEPIHPQGPYPQGPYQQGPNPQGPYPQEPHLQESLSQEQLLQGPHQQYLHQQDSHLQGPMFQESHPLQKPDGMDHAYQPTAALKSHVRVNSSDNSVNKTWNWNYKEYQI